MLATPRSNCDGWSEESRWMTVSVENLSSNEARGWHVTWIMASALGCAYWFGASAATPNRDG